MKIKELKWKKVKGEYIAKTPYGECFFIEFCGDKWRLDATYDCIEFKSDTLEKAKNRAFKEWCKYLKEQKYEIDRMNKMFQKCLEEE